MFYKNCLLKCIINFVLAKEDKPLEISSYMQQFQSNPKFHETIKTLNETFSFCKLVKKIQKLHKHASKNDKARWLSLVSKEHTPKQLRAWGFTFSKSQLKRSRQIDFNVESFPGRRETSQKIKDTIIEWVKKQATPAANKTIKKKQDGNTIIQPVYHVHCCIKNLYPFFLIFYKYC